MPSVAITPSAPNITALSAPHLRATTHELRVWPDCFASFESGAKPFDVRENDRNFQVGDLLLLHEYDPETQQYTGRVLTRWLSYLLSGGAFGVAEGWCVLGLNELPPLPPGIHDTKLW